MKHKANSMITYLGRTWCHVDVVQVGWMREMQDEERMTDKLRNPDWRLIGLAHLASSIVKCGLPLEWREAVSTEEQN